MLSIGDGEFARLKSERVKLRSYLGWITSQKNTENFAENGGALRKIFEEIVGWKVEFIKEVIQKAKARFAPGKKKVVL